MKRALQGNPFACIAAFDVDQDDYEGVCSAPFMRLQALRTAQGELSAKPGKYTSEWGGFFFNRVLLLTADVFTVPSGMTPDRSHFLWN